MIYSPRKRASKIPSAYEFSCGAYYRTTGRNDYPVTMHREHNVYLVNCGPVSKGFYTYREAINYLFSIAL